MALQTWLPLNGNLDNHGVSVDAITKSGTLTYESGKIGQALSLSGCYIKCPWSSVQEELTVAFWIKPNSPTLWSDIISFGENNRIEISSSSGGYTWYAGAAAMSLVTSGTSIFTLTDSAWTHVAFTASGTQVKFYLNGALVKTMEQLVPVSTVFTNNKFFNIGARTDGGMSGQYNGHIDDVRLYDSCLSAKQIKEIAKGLTIHYKLDNIYHTNYNLAHGYYNQNTGGGWGGTLGVATYVDKIDPLPFDKVLKYTITYDSAVGGGGTSVYPPANYAVTGSTEYTYSTYVKAEDDLAYLNANFLYRYEYDASNTKVHEAGVASSSRKIYVGNGWYRIWGTFTTKETTTSVSLPFYTYPQKNIVYYLGGEQLELGNQLSPYIDNTYLIQNVECDVSGNGYDGLYKNGLKYITESKRGTGCTNFNGTSGCVYKTNVNLGNVWTISLWCKPEGLSTTTQYLISLNSGNSGSDGQQLAIYLNNTSIVYHAGGTKTTISKALQNNQWYHIALICDGTTQSCYLDGEKIGSGSVGTATGTNFTIGARSNNTAGAGTSSVYYYFGDMADVRVYATALADSDIKTLYRQAGYVDHVNSWGMYDFIEVQPNKLEKIDGYIREKQMTGGVSRCTQTNCQVTLTDDGYRIYRPPNIIHDSSTMHNMWGGLRFQPFTSDPVFLQKGHTYIILFDIKGQTSKTPGFHWSNNMGWGGGGLNPTPTNVSSKRPSADWQSDTYETFYYKWTIEDDIYKVCTSAYSSFVAGNTYLSYKDFCIEFGYQNTGELGTDIYIRNFRCYDITNVQNAGILPEGIASTASIQENDYSARIHSSGELGGDEYIEI